MHLKLINYNEKKLIQELKKKNFGKEKLRTVANLTHQKLRHSGSTIGTRINGNRNKSFKNLIPFE